MNCTTDAQSNNLRGAADVTDGGYKVGRDVRAINSQSLGEIMAWASFHIPMHSLLSVSVRAAQVGRKVSATTGQQSVPLR